LSMFDGFYGAEDTFRLVKDFVRDVWSIRLTMAEKRAVERRTAHVKVADDTDNIRDMHKDFFTIPSRLKAFYKGFIIAHEGGVKYSSWKTNRKDLERVWAQSILLLSSIRDEVNNDIQYLVKEGFVDSSIDRGYTCNLDDYFQSGGLLRRTGPDKGSGGTLNRYIRIVRGDEVAKRSVEDYSGQFMDSIVMSALANMMLKGITDNEDLVPPRISGLALKEINKIGLDGFNY
ncbi:MAG: hypothetical protein ABIJ08_01320, partial [Nanoarchaeota archaeon]